MMPEHNSHERITSGAVEVPATVPIAAYPTEVDSAAGTLPLVEYWRILMKRRWTVLSILLLVVVTVMIGTLRQQPVYEAAAIVHIDRQSPNILSFQDFVAEMNPYDDTYLETAYSVLQSRTLAYRVISKLGLADMPEFAGEAASDESWLASLTQNAPTEAPITPEEQLDPKYSRAIDEFLGRLQVNPVRRSQLVEISFETHDPALSARVANTLAANYIDMNLEANWEATQKASDWLSQQLVGLKVKLEQSEEELQRYAKDNSILFLDERQSMSAQKLQQLQEEGTRAQAELIQKESLYNQIQSSDFSSLPGIQENKLYQDLTLKLADMKREYSDLTATFTPEYPRVKRLQTQIDEISATLERERAAFARRVGDDYRAAQNRERLLNQAIAEQTREFNQIAEKSIQYNILKRETDTNKQLYDGLLQRLKEASVSAGMRASNIRVVDPAEIPEYPSRPRKVLNLALSLVVGLSLGVCLAFFQEYLDNTLKTPEDVQKQLHLPALGVIPAADGPGRSRLPYGYGRSRKALPEAAAGASNGNHNGSVAVAAEGNGALSEAYRSLRTSVLLSTSGRPPRVILVTSGQPGEGKTTTAVNLAVALVQLGAPVLVVDSDMRRPRVGALLQLINTSAGLSTYLTGQYSLEDVVVETKIPNLYAVPCGPIPPNPAELLSSSLMRQFLEQAAQRFSYVILDSPPVLHVSDPRILAAQVEAVILVAHGGVTPREVVKRAKQNLQQVNANLIGVALNNVDFSAAGYNHYYSQYHGYGEGYASQDPASHEQRPV